MKLSRIHITIFLAILLLPIASVLKGQEEVDSILRVARLHIFDNPNQAIDLSENLLAQDNLSEDEQVQILLVLATAYTSKRDYQKALDYALRTESFIPEISTTTQISSLNKIGGLYHDLKLFNQAVTYLDRSLQIIETYPNPDSIPNWLAYNYGTRGFIYSEQMSCEIALTYFDKSIEQFKKDLSETSKANISIVLYNKGNCLRDLDRYDEALEVYTESVQYAEQIHGNSLIAFAEKGLAEVYSLQGEHEYAQDILVAALAKSESVGDLALNREIYYNLANTYLAANDWERYLQYFQQYQTTTQIMEMEERKTINTSLQQMATDQKDQLVKLEKQFLMKKGVLLAILIVSIILGILLFIRYRKILSNLKTNLPLHS